MSTLFFERTPFDILIRNFLDNTVSYRPVERNLKISHPLDIFTTEEGLTFEIACTGIPKKEIEVLTQDNTLRVNYNKKAVEVDEDGEPLETENEYLYRGIAKRSFNLGWKIDNKYSVEKATATFNNGLLTIVIPFTEGSELKTLKIK